MISRSPGHSGVLPTKAGACGWVDGAVGAATPQLGFGDSTGFNLCVLAYIDDPGARR